MDIKNFSVSHGDAVIYSNFSVSFADGTVTAILGPSGCGKTTLLNHIASGAIGAQVSYIFQEPRLIPWRTLEKNIMLSLGRPSAENRERTREYLSRVGLEKRAGEYPDRLSGGERQRASIARAFANPAPVLLMDEPFQSQDPGQKKALIELVRSLQINEPRTIIFVSHDVADAVAMAERAIIINGRPVSVVLDARIDDGSERMLSEVLSCQRAEW